MSKLVTALLMYLLGSHGANSYLPPLDVYCSSVTSGNISFSSKPRLNKYQRICRDVDSYIACVLKNRASHQETPPFEVYSFERFFPRADDLTRATYMFCSQNLIELQRQFDTDTLHCEKQCDTTLCMSKFAAGDIFFMLNEATAEYRLQYPYSLDLIQNFSCSILAPLTNCIEMQFVRCDRKYELFKDYELGKLGGMCLAENNLHSPLVTERLYNSSAISSSNLAVAIFSVSAVQVIWSVTNF
ncbi:hypothetical protein BsWGS_21301 [Bradybaena similaris]